MKVTAANASEAHGRVERQIETSRWTLDRWKYMHHLRTTRPQWRTILYTIESNMNNEVGAKDGTSASMRTTGRSTHLLDPWLAGLGGASQLWTKPEVDDDVAVMDGAMVGLALTHI